VRTITRSSSATRSAWGSARVRILTCARIVSATAPGGVILYWHVDDIEASIARLVELGATVHQPPRDFSDEGYIGASVIDPFGNILGIMQNPHYLEVLASMTER